ncbi:hypothetical protein M9458_052460 [Cirrhinus mrigala]|uniref:DDE Tnp4 domain-containing protein n=1 Tax=Cirrhinus mrigala TaxID=683832 RepID=A0ABD0MUA8_CIRMR
MDEICLMIALRCMRSSPNNITILRRRRRTRAITAAGTCASIIVSSTIQRNVWVRERSQEWWEHIVAGFTEEQWVQNFRMSKRTFDMLCQRLSTFLSYDDTTFRRAIPLQMRVGVALWWLATGVGYRTLAYLFGISSASVCLIVNDFCQAMRDELLREYIQLPQLDELQNCTGAIDGSHIPVIAPSEDHTDYFNRKGWHSVILQAVVDHRFWNSDIYDKAERGLLFPNVPIMLLGDPAYPLRPWIRKGYPDTGNLTDDQRYFNQRLSRARMTVECAFAGPPEATGEDGDPVGAVDTRAPVASLMDEVGLLSLKRAESLIEVSGES